jgi:hypothetical protein
MRPVARSRYSSTNNSAAYSWPLLLAQLRIGVEHALHDRFSSLGNIKTSATASKQSRRKIELGSRWRLLVDASCHERTACITELATFAGDASPSRPSPKTMIASGLAPCHGFNGSIRSLIKNWWVPTVMDTDLD